MTVRHAARNASGQASQRPGATFGAELRDAVSIRTMVMVIGVLALQLGFILSYIGAFHAPQPQRIPVAVVAPSEVAAQAAARINSIPGQPLRANAVSDDGAARRDIASGSLSAALIINPARSTDQLLVASGGGASVTSAVEAVATQAEAAQHRHVTITDIVPLQKGDGRGLSGFYLVVGWLVGGYLVAALLGIAGGARPANHRRAAIRLLALIPYAIASGLGGAVIVGPVLGALTGHFLALWALGVLVVLSAATVTMAFQVLLGVLGVGVTVLLFVVLGNPSAGGAYQPSMLPPFWRALSSALPNGAGTEIVRRIIYFGSQGITAHLAVLAAYATAGAIIALAVPYLRQRRLAMR
jgi:hypothetical protein